MNKTIVIDGRQLAGQIGGVQRVIREELKELDKIASPGDYEILLPKGVTLDISYKNISVKNYGILNGLLWEQICLPFYLFKNRCFGYFPCTITSFLYPKGMVVVHDVMLAACKELADNFSNPIAKQLLLWNYRTAAKHADMVIVDAEFTKNDIMRLYHTPEDKIRVVGLGWQHILNVASEDSWKEKYPILKPGEYYFSLSANRKQKNFKWIYEVAKRNPNSVFAMAGTQEEWQKQAEFDAPNIIHLGFISDGEVRSLMENCKAFLFPSTYEGFGIPPLEALAVGARIIVANATCLPELYRNSAYYIDPYDYEVDLDKLLENEVAPASEVLDRFSWEKAAAEIHRLRSELLDE